MYNITLLLSMSLQLQLEVEQSYVSFYPLIMSSNYMIAKSHNTLLTIKSQKRKASKNNWMISCGKNKGHEQRGYERTTLSFLFKVHMK